MFSPNIIRCAILPPWRRSIRRRFLQALQRRPGVMRYIEQPFRGARGVFFRPILFFQAAAAWGSSALTARPSILPTACRRGSRQTFSPTQTRLRKFCLVTNMATLWRPQRASLASAPYPRPFSPGTIPTRDGACACTRGRPARGVGCDVRERLPPQLGVERTDMPEVVCRRHNEAVYAYLQASNIDTVVLISHWAPMSKARARAARGRRGWLP
jgi:hypothetical protein